MQTTTKEGFLLALKEGDIGLICAKNLFATLQNLYREREKEGPLQASHGFYMRQPPRIVEANGLFVSGDSTIIKNIGDTTKCWIFRFPDATVGQVGDMSDYVDGMVDGGGHYSVGGIMQFALQFCGVRKKIAEEGGVFCTELTGRTILEGKLPYILEEPPYAVTPSFQLNWFLTKGVTLGWQLAGHYDGAGNFQIV